MLKGSKKYWVIAIFCGLLTAFLFYQYLQDLELRYSPDNLVPVVMARDTIIKDTAITASQLKVEYLPAQYVQPQALRDKKEVIGKSATVDIASGEQILKSRLLSQGDKQKRLSYGIPNNKRAVSIAVDNISGVGGYIQAGDRVDLVATLDIPQPGNAKTAFSILSLQDIEVLAMGNNFDASNKNPTGTKTITLAVAVEEALPLVMASERGNVRLLLRSPVDRSRTDIAPYQLQDLIQYSGQ